MQLLNLLAAAATLAVAQAKVQFDNSAFVVTAGQPFNFTWSGAEGAVSLLLKDGPATNLSTVETIANGLSGTSYQWAVPSSLVQNTYAFEIDDGTSTNYSPQFQLIGGVASSASVTTVTTSSGSSTSATISTVTPSSNGTTSSTSGSAASKTSSGSSSSSAKTSSATTPASTTSAPSSANGLSSPLAFVFLALAAFFTLN